MEVRIENLFFGWHEKLPETFIELLNALVLTKDEQEVREVMASFAEKEDYKTFFLHGFGKHHLWVHQCYASDSERILPDRLLSVHF